MTSLPEPHTASRSGTGSHALSVLELVERLMVALTPEGGWGVGERSCRGLPHGPGAAWRVVRLHFDSLDLANDGDQVVALGVVAQFVEVLGHAIKKSQAQTRGNEWQGGGRKTP